MDLEEATEICKKLSDINVEIWGSRDPHKKALVQEFKALAKTVVDAGYRISRKKVAIGSKLVPLFTPKAPRKRHFCYEHVDMRPKGCNARRDCTTRCLSFCLGIGYTEAKAAQEAMSKREFGTPSYWNYEHAWGNVLVENGWKKVRLPRKMARFNLAKATSDFDFPMVTHSSHHVAAMLKGKVIDNWDSQGGRVDFVYVPSSEAKAFVHRICS